MVAENAPRAAACPAGSGCAALSAGLPGHIRVQGVPAGFGQGPFQASAGAKFADSTDFPFAVRALLCAVGCRFWRACAPDRAAKPLYAVDFPRVLTVQGAAAARRPGGFVTRSFERTEARRRSCGGRMRSERVSCRSGQTARVGRAAKRPKGKAEGRSLDPHGTAGRSTALPVPLSLRGAASGCVRAFFTGLSLPERLNPSPAASAPLLPIRPRRRAGASRQRRPKGKAACGRSLDPDRLLWTGDGRCARLRGYRLCAAELARG